MVGRGHGCPESSKEISLRAVGYALSMPEADASRRDQSLTTIYWNQLARELVGSHRVDPPRASRLYALLSIAQHDAALSDQAAKDITSSAIRPPEYLQRLRIEGASRALLSELLHVDPEYISEFRFRNSYPTLTTEDLELAYQSGRATALQLLKQRQDDRSDDASQVVAPTGPYVLCVALSSEPATCTSSLGLCSTFRSKRTLQSSYPLEPL